MTAPAKLPSPMCQAALQYARQGWPVFPCRERDDRSTNGAGKEIVYKAKAPYTGKGLKDATTDEARILAWWRQHPEALIGLPMGVNGMFALDFDPRVDEETGEVFTLERLKAELEAQMGCALPESLTAVTQSDGVHVYFRQPDGEPIRNRGNLPQHVDVRGLGGYVIAPPSVMAETGARYRWHRGDWRDEAAVAEAPAVLIEILRDRKRAAPKPREDSPSGAAPDVAVDEAVRKYALAALDGECEAIRRAPSGQRNNQLNISTLKVASLVAAGALNATLARQCIEAAARDNTDDDDRQLAATIDSGWTAGMSNPRDLSEIAAAARDRAARGSGGRSRSSRPRPPSSTASGTPSSQGGGSVSEAGGDGARGGGDDEADALTRRCAFFPQTDLGNLERFLARFGDDFLYVEQWGWLAWDGKRWNRDMAQALLGHAVQRTMRSIQEEAELVRASGIPDEPLEMWDAEQKRAHERQQKGKLDRIVKRARGEITLLSDTIAKWGRTSEGAGHINCIAKLAEARLSARPGDFDADPLLLNMQSGTIVFMRPDEGFPASVEEREHRREDRITKIGEARYDPKATCPKFDAFLEEVQPALDMRDFLDTWAGYNALGLADAQKMALFYGEGSNGKGVWVNTIAYILGDYAWATGIETFIDQGKYRKGSDASPDLAALAGRRMVHANEPEDHSKFSDGLIKALTSDEPKGGVRELMKPPFQLEITFTNTVMANNMPKIGTDHGIQRRVQVVPWGVIIPDERTDLRLKDKLKAESSGILNRMVSGALRYLTEGLSLPEAVKEATREYQQENDILGRFLDLVVARVPGESVGATPLHRVFVAWQAWAGQLGQNGKGWSMKYLNGQMKKKSFKNGKSSTMQWLDIALRYEELDFVSFDDKGHASPVERELPEPKTFPGEIGPNGKPVAAAPPPPPAPSDESSWGDDDVP